MSEPSYSWDAAADPSDELVDAAQNCKVDELESALDGIDTESAGQQETLAVALRAAAKAGHKRCLKMLLEAGADADGMTDGAESTDPAPLVLAARYGHVGCVKALLRAGADLGGALITFGRTPLIAAAKGGHEDVLKALLQHGGGNADVDDVDERYRSALYYAAAEGPWPECCELLIKAGADVEAAAEQLQKAGRGQDAAELRSMAEEVAAAEREAKRKRKRR